MHYFWIALRYYATFKGRTSQRGYWYYQLVISIVSLICLGIPLIYFTYEMVQSLKILAPQIQQHIQQATQQALANPSHPLPLATFDFKNIRPIPHLWYISLLSHLGTLFGLATIIPGLAINVRRLHDTGRSGGFLWLALIPIIGWIILLVWFCKHSQPKANQYGANPVDTASGTTMPIDLDPNHVT